MLLEKNAVHGTSLSLIVRFGVLGILIPALPGTCWKYISKRDSGGCVFNDSGSNNSNHSNTHSNHI